MERLDTATFVETPERVRFRIHRAGPGLRAASAAIDLVLQAVLVLLVGGAALGLGWVGSESPWARWQGVGWGGLSIWTFAVQWFYASVFEVVFSGQTPGKALLGLRVLRIDGTPASVSDLLLRNLLRAVDMLPAAYGLAALAMFIDRDHRRIGDWVAGTLVARELRVGLGAPPTVEPPTDAERRHLPQRVELRADEIANLRNFLSRRSALSDARAEELAALWGPALAARTGMVSARWERVLALAYWVAIRGEERG